MESSQNDQNLTPSAPKKQYLPRNSVFVCTNCQQQTKHYGHGFCKRCYYIHVPKQFKACKECGKEKRIYCQGLCSACHFKNARKVDVCQKCKEEKIISGRGLCRKCYYREFMKRKEKQNEECKECGGEKQLYRKGICQRCYFQKNKKVDVCQKCKKEKQIHRRGFCQKCYFKNVKKIGVCQKCKEEKPIISRGFCRSCYYSKDVNSRKKKTGECKGCGEEKQIHFRGFCQQCHNKKVDNNFVCQGCQQQAKHCSRGFCRPCYYLNVTKPRLSNNSNVSTPRSSKVKKSCIGKEAESNTLKELNIPQEPESIQENELFQEFLCAKCHLKDKTHYANDMCQLCYFMNYRHGKNETPTSTNEKQWNAEDFLLNLDDQEILCEDDYPKNKSQRQVKSLANNDVLARKLSPMIITLDEDENSQTSQQNLNALLNSPMIITLDDENSLPSTSQSTSNLIQQNKQTSKSQENRLTLNSIAQQRPQIAVPSQINYVDLSSGDEDDDGEY